MSTGRGIANFVNRAFEWPKSLFVGKGETEVMQTQNAVETKKSPAQAAVERLEKKVAPKLQFDSGAFPSNVQEILKQSNVRTPNAILTLDKKLEKLNGIGPKTREKLVRAAREQIGEVTEPMAEIVTEDVPQSEPEPTEQPKLPFSVSDEARKSLKEKGVKFFLRDGRVTLNRGAFKFKKRDNKSVVFTQKSFDPKKWDTEKVWAVSWVE